MNIKSHYRCGFSWHIYNGRNVLVSILWSGGGVNIPEPRSIITSCPPSTYSSCACCLEIDSCCRTMSHTSARPTMHRPNCPKSCISNTPVALPPFEISSLTLALFGFSILFVFSCIMESEEEFVVLLVGWGLLESAWLGWLRVFSAGLCVLWRLAALCSCTLDSDLFLLDGTEDIPLGCEYFSSLSSDFPGGSSLLKTTVTLEPAASLLIFLILEVGLLPISGSNLSKHIMTCCKCTAHNPCECKTLPNYLKPNWDHRLYYMNAHNPKRKNNKETIKPSTCE